MEGGPTHQCGGGAGGSSKQGRRGARVVKAVLGRKLREAQGKRCSAVQCSAVQRVHCRSEQRGGGAGEAVSRPEAPAAGGATGDSMAAPGQRRGQQQGAPLCGGSQREACACRPAPRGGRRAGTTQGGQGAGERLQGAKCGARGGGGGGGGVMGPSSGRRRRRGGEGGAVWGDRVQGGWSWRGSAGEAMRCRECNAAVVWARERRGGGTTEAAQEKCRKWCSGGPIARALGGGRQGCIGSGRALIGDPRSG